MRPSVMGMRALRRWISKGRSGVKALGSVSSQRMVRRKKSNLSTWDGARAGKVIVVVVIDCAMLVLPSNAPGE
jgi:hypothetical protein